MTFPAGMSKFLAAAAGMSNVATASGTGVAPSVEMYGMFGEAYELLAELAPTVYSWADSLSTALLPVTAQEADTHPSTAQGADAGGLAVKLAREEEEEDDFPEADAEDPSDDLCLGMAAAGPAWRKFCEWHRFTNNVKGWSNFETQWVRAYPMRGADRQTTGLRDSVLADRGSPVTEATVQAYGNGEPRLALQDGDALLEGVRIMAARPLAKDEPALCWPHATEAEQDTALFPGVTKLWAHLRARNYEVCDPAKSGESLDEASSAQQGTEKAPCQTACCSLSADALMIAAAESEGAASELAPWLDGVAESAVALASYHPQYQNKTSVELSPIFLSDAGRSRAGLRRKNADHVWPEPYCYEVVNAAPFMKERGLQVTEAALRRGAALASTLASARSKEQRPPATPLTDALLGNHALGLGRRNVEPRRVSDTETCLVALEDVQPGEPFMLRDAAGRDPVTLWSETGLMHYSFAGFMVELAQIPERNWQSSGVNVGAVPAFCRETVLPFAPTEEASFSRAEAAFLKRLCAAEFREAAREQSETTQQGGFRVTEDGGIVTEDPAALAALLQKMAGEEASSSSPAEGGEDAAEVPSAHAEL